MVGVTRLATLLFLAASVFASPYGEYNPKPTTCKKPSTVTLTKNRTCTVTKYSTKTKTIQPVKTKTIKVPVVSKKTITITKTLTVPSVSISISRSDSLATITNTASFTDTLTASFTDTVTNTLTNTESLTETSLSTETFLSTETTTESTTITESSTETSISTEVSSTTLTETFTPACVPQATPYLKDDSFATSTQANGFYSFWTVATATSTAPNSYQTGGPGSNNVFQYIGTHPNGYGANYDFYSLQVVVYGNQIVRVSQKATLCAGVTYKLSAFWNYAGGTDFCQADICFDGAECKSGGRYRANNFPGQPTTDRYGWLPYSNTYTPTVSGEVEVQFKFHCNGTAVNNGNRLYLDHAMFSIV